MSYLAVHMPSIQDLPHLDDCERGCETTNEAQSRIQGRREVCGACMHTS